MEGHIQKVVTHDELCILIAHLVRCEDLLRVAIGKVCNEDFDDSEAGFRLIFQIARDFYVAHHRLVPQAYMITEIKAKCAQSPSLNQEALIDNIIHFSGIIYAWADLIPAYAQEVLGDFIWQRQVGKKILDMAGKGYTTHSMWEELQQAAVNAEVEVSDDIMPFSLDQTPRVGVLPRNPTGVSFLDEMLNGGTRPGELFGFLAPSGGGKTTMTHMLAIECARQKQHAVVFSYEESLTDDYFISVYACATKIPRKRWEALRKVDDLKTVFTREEYAKFQEIRGHLGKYLHYVDMKTKGGTGGVTEIDAKLAYFKKKCGGNITMFAVDWFWPMVMRHYNILELDKGKRLDIRVYAQGVTDALKGVAAKHGAWCWLPHQLNPAEGKKKKRQTFEDAAELKSFAWFMNGCFCFGKMGEADGMGPLDFSKARSQKRSDIIVQLQGDISTFVKVDSDRQFDPTEQRYVKTDDLHKVPEARNVHSAERTEHEGFGRVRS